MKGYVEAIVARIDVVSANATVFKPGCVEDPEGLVMVSLMDHSSIKGFGERPMVGFGTISEEGRYLMFKGRIDVGTERGYFAHQMIRYGAECLGWSVYYDSLKKDQGEHDGGRIEVVYRARFIEVSPTPTPADRGTVTLYTVPPMTPWPNESRPRRNGDGKSTGVKLLPTLVEPVLAAPCLTPG